MIIKYIDGAMFGFMLGAACMSIWHGTWFMPDLGSTSGFWFAGCFLVADIFLWKGGKK